MSRIEIKDSVWTIPAARYKTGVDTDVPLSAAALEVLERLPRIGADKYVFTRDGERPFQGIRAPRPSSTRHVDSPTG